MPGVCESLIQLLALKYKCLPEIAKHCVVTWDEMSLKKELKYDAVKDRIDGLVHLSSRQPIPCNQALVYMVGGLANNWKQPVAFFISENAASPRELHILLNQLLEAVCKIGLLPVVAVCDQGSCNRALFNKLGVTAKQPFIEVCGALILFLLS